MEINPILVEGEHQILVYNYLENNNMRKTLDKCIIIFR
jgi:hypothetical protein